jgi:hypothetical protein
MPMRHPVAVILGLALVVAVAHGGAVRDSFLYDDFQLIVDNPAVSRHDWGMIWTSGEAGSADASGRNRPVTLSTYAIDRLVGGGRAAVYHATQVAWHGLVVVLVYLVGRALWRRPAPAIAAALLVAVHPVQIEAVHYLSARASILSTAGMLVALWAHLVARERAGLMALSMRGLGLVAFTAACLSKESAIVLVVWVAAYELIGARAPAREAMIRLAPYAAVAVAALVWQHLAAPDVWGQGASVPRATGLATGAVVVARHIAAWVAPIGIEPVSPQPWTAWTGPAVLPAVAWLVGAAACLVWGWRRAPLASSATLDSCLASWGGVCGLTALLPVMILPFMTNVALFQPHRGYTASVGFALATVGLTRAVAAWALPRVNPGAAARMPAVGLATGLVLLAGAIGFDARQGAAWRDEVRFWSEAAARYPGEAAYAHSLGAARLRANDAPGAIEAFSTALRLDPTIPRARYNLGLAYTSMGRLDEAREAYERAIERDPSDVKALVNLGMLEERRGDPAGALRAYRTAVRLAPGLDRIRERIERLAGAR